MNRKPSGWCARTAHHRKSSACESAVLCWHLSLAGNIPALTRCVLHRAAIHLTTLGCGFAKIISGSSHVSGTRCARGLLVHFANGLCAARPNVPPQRWNVLLKARSISNLTVPPWDKQDFYFPRARLHRSSFENLSVACAEKEKVVPFSAQPLSRKVWRPGLGSRAARRAQSTHSACSSDRCLRLRRYYLVDNEARCVL